MPASDTSPPPPAPGAARRRPGPSRPLAGVLWMLATGLCFVAVTAIVKHVGASVPAAQAAFLRYALGLVFLVPMLGPIRAARLGPRALRLFALRGVVHTAGVVCWFYAMTQIPIAEVTAMNYLSPVYVALGAAFLLGERLAIRRLAAIGIALLGAFVVLRPGFREISPGHVAMIFTAILFAVSYLIAKIMADEVSASVVVGMLSITVTVGLAPLAAVVWVTPTAVDLAWLFLVAAFATGGHYAMTLAFAAAPMAVTQPVTFLQLVWATLLGALVFGEAADPFVILGGTLIVASVAYIAWRETLNARRGGEADGRDAPSPAGRAGARSDPRA